MNESDYMADAGEALSPGWIWVTVSDVCDVNPRMVWQDEYSVDMPITFVPMSSVDEVSGIILHPQEEAIGDVWRGYTRFHEGDVIFAKITPCMENGKVAIATNLINGLGCGSTEFHVLRSNGSVLIEWLYHYVRQQSFRNDARKNMKGTAGQLRVPAQFIADYPFPLPPLAEQARIVEAIEALFTRLDAGVAALKRLRVHLRRYKAAVLKAACEGTLVPQDPTDEPASALLERILTERRERWEAEQRAKGKDTRKQKYEAPAAPDVTDLPELPEGWVWATTEMVVECLDRFRRPVNKKERSSRSGQIPYYGANGQVGWIDDYLFDEELVLVVEDETFTGREKPFSYKIEGKSWVNNHAHVLRAIAVDIDYLNYSLAFYPFTPLTTGTTGRRKLTQEALLQAAYALPPASEQQRIVQTVENLLSICEEVIGIVNVGLHRAERLRQAILREAFAGRLVPQDPADEPAAALLARIQQARGESGAGRTKKTSRKARS